MRDRDDDENGGIHIGRLTPGDVALLKNIAEEAAERTVRRFSTAMGIDPEDPMLAQRNMQWLNRTRERYEGMHGKVIMTALGVAVAGALQAGWTGVKTIIGAGTVPGSH